MSGKRKQSKRKHQNGLVYAVSILALTALVGAAFFGPGWVFGLQDGKQCSDTVLGQRENVDVAVLSTNYESSFYQRMINFAENQSEDTNYYVASEELTDYERLADFLYSEYGLYSDNIWTLMDAGLVTDHIFECEVSAWKQYVIYSDDYAKGVNFILWYIELENPDEEIGTYKLLLEANTGEFYGLQADTGGTLADYDRNYDKFSYGDQYSLEDYLNMMPVVPFLVDDAWTTLAYFYSGLSESDFFQFYDLYYGMNAEMYDSEMADINANELAEVDMEIKKLMEKLEIDGTEWLDFLRTYPMMVIWDEGNRLECTFPYGKGRMVFRMQMEESVPPPWTLHHVTVGFPAIYSLIPEFGEY